MSMIMIRARAHAKMAAVAVAAVAEKKKKVKKRGLTRTEFYGIIQTSVLNAVKKDSRRSHVSRYSLPSRSPSKLC